jgi:hypothetical protein
MVDTTVASMAAFCVCTFASLATGRKIVFKLKRKEGQNNNHSDNNGDVVFTATLKNGTLSDDIWICVLECISHILNPNMDSVKLNVCALISNSKCENSDENYYVLVIV